MALKRPRSEDDEPVKSNAAVKRQRTGSRRPLLDFSDEVLLRILSFLPVPQLLCIER